MPKARIAPASAQHPSGAGRRVRARALDGTGARASRVSVVLALAMLCSAALALSLVPASALAETHRGFTGSFGKAGAGEGEFSGPAGLAVNQSSGDVYVSDAGNGRIQYFTASGGYLGQFNGSGLLPGEVTAASSGQLSAPESVAVDNACFYHQPSLTGAACTSFDPSDGDVYVTDTGHMTVDKFSATGGYLCEIRGPSRRCLKAESEESSAEKAAPPFGGLIGVAVGTGGVVWVYAEKAGKAVGQENAEIESYSNAEPNSFVEGHESKAGGDAWPGFAVDGEGNLYVGHRDRRTVGKVSGTGQLIEEEVRGEGSIAVAVDLDSSSSEFDDVFINSGTLVDVLSAAVPPVPVETFGARHPVSGTGIAVDSATGAVYVSDTANDVVDIFTLGETPQEAPKTAPASEVLATTATLHGELNPGGGSGALEYRFDYNRGSSCTGGQSAPVPNGELAEAKQAPVEAKVTGLQPNAQYTYCLVAIDPFGTTQGSEVSFETGKAPPVIVGESTSVPVRAKEATLQARINPNNQETSYSFQYAENPALTGATTVPEAEPPLTGYSLEGQQVSVATGETLTPNTTYYYRVIAKNASNEEATGNIEHFTTAIPPEAPTGLSASPVAATTATLNGVLNPNAAGNPGIYEFRYAQSATSCENGEVVGGVTLGNTPEAVKSEITGLLPGVPYTFCLRAENEAGEEATGTAPVTFTTLAAAPTIEAKSQSVTEVTANSATLGAVVNPGGAETAYRFEYTSEEQFQREGFTGAARIPIPDGQLSPGNEGNPVTAHPQGLQPGIVYHFRVVAENTISKSEGKPVVGEVGEKGEEIVHTFNTQTNGAFALPDKRTWELVSPADKHGALIEDPESVGAVQAATDGDSFTYLTSAPTESQPQGNSNHTQVLSTRTNSGWGSLDIATSREIANGFNQSAPHEEYRFFSEDLSLSVVQPVGVALAPLSPEATERTPFLRTDYTGGNREAPCVSSCYLPLVTGAPGFADVPEGTKIAPTCTAMTAAEVCQPEVEGASSDGHHIVLRSTYEPLTTGAPNGSLYEWTEGQQLQLVSILPNGTAANQMILGSVLSLNGSGHEKNIVKNAISVDGSRIVWSDTEGLYLRDVTSQKTVELGGKNAKFQVASGDGSRVFFTSNGDLSVFEAPSNGLLSAGHVTDLTPGGELRGLVLGASQDASSVYFVASGVLNTAPSASGEVAQTDQPNLYVYRAGVTKLIAVLSEEDHPDWGEYSKGYVTPTRVSSNGRWLAFMSERPLTGYDNRDAASSVPDEEVFLYDAMADGGQGRLVCASCNATGARPHGVFDEAVISGKTPLFDRELAWDGGRWLAGNVPEATTELYQSRYLSDSGSLFFNSHDALVPSDVNNTEDVYEYEPDGVGSCTSATGPGSSVSLVGSKGCVSLISSGTNKEESAFLDASEGGDDVFFLTSAQLSTLDSDSLVDVYDARVDGGFPVPSQQPACEGDACQSPVAAPNDPTPGSLTFQGPGNVAPHASPPVLKKAVRCKRGFVKKHGRCVKTRLKKKSKKRSGKAIDKRRAK